MQFKISTTYEIWDDEAYEAGDTDDKGFSELGKIIGYQDLIKLIEAEGYNQPSSYPRANGHTWLSTADGTLHNDGTTEYNSLHISRANGRPVSIRTMNKILRSAGIRT